MDTLWQQRKQEIQNTPDKYPPRNQWVDWVAYYEKWKSESCPYPPRFHENPRFDMCVSAIRLDGITEYYLDSEHEQFDKSWKLAIKKIMQHYKNDTHVTHAIQSKCTLTAENRLINGQGNSMNTRQSAMVVLNALSTYQKTAEFKYYIPELESKLQKLYKEIVGKETWLDKGSWLNHYTKIQTQGGEGDLLKQYLNSDIEYQEDSKYEKLLFKCLYKMQDNGISDAGITHFSKDKCIHFLKNTNFFKALVEIANDQNEYTYEVFDNEWKNCAENYKPKRVNHLLINRTVAFFTDKVSTVVDKEKFNEVFNWLQKEEYVPKYEGEDNWFSKNIYLMEILKKEIEVDNQYKLNLFPWFIYDNMDKIQDFSKQIKESKIMQKQRNRLLNQILYGPPGTGKTYSIKDKVKDILELYYDKDEILKFYDKQNKYIDLEKLKKDNTLDFITFHPAYGYEEFIEGIRPYLNKPKPNLNKNEETSQTASSDSEICPNLNKDEGTVSYHIHDGVFKKLCNLAKDNLAKDEPNRPYFMIIDEINRGNIPKIFGELITLIEDNKRGGNPESISVTLPYSSESFTVPNNVHIIGTMNTADKSLTALDTALRRRFIFIEMMPKPELIAKDNNDIIDNINVRNLLTDINNNIKKQNFERSHHIGHAFFMNCDGEQDVIYALAYKIIPLLQEYTYDDWENIKKILNVDIKIDTSEIDFEKIAKCTINQYNIESKEQTDKSIKIQNDTVNKILTLEQAIEPENINEKKLDYIEIDTYKTNKTTWANVMIEIFKHFNSQHTEKFEEFCETSGSCIHESNLQEKLSKIKESRHIDIKEIDNTKWSYDTNKNTDIKMRDLKALCDLCNVTDTVQIYLK